MPLFQKHIALPQQHGAWALWLGPFTIGLGVSPALKPDLLWLVLASVGGFLGLQPLTHLVKVVAGRRPQTDLTPAIFWSAVYGVLTGIGLLGLLMTGHSFVLGLGLVALPVLAWQLWLVARRAERGQMGVELIGAGVLALAAPAAYWVNSEGTPAVGGWLFVLCWLQAAGAIVYIYLRLEHRRLNVLPAWPERLRLGRRALLYNVGNVIIVTALAAAQAVPWGVIVPFVALALETVYGGLLRPGIGAKPVTIGIRQVLVTAVFTVLMIVAYRI